MSCSQFDLKGYFLNELSEAEKKQVRAHVKSCVACREELDRLRLTQAALHSLQEEEPPRRIAFVSDEVFQPSWWRRFWASGARLGFASAALVAAAILVHAFVRPAPVVETRVASVDTAEIEKRVAEEVARRLQPAIAKAVAESESRQAGNMQKLVAATRRQLESRQASDRAAIEQAFLMLNNKLNARQYANAGWGGQR